MNSIFSNKNLLPQLTRRSRTRTKRDVTSPSKAKPLDILPDLAEEDETRWSTSSAPTSSSSSLAHGVSCSMPLSGRSSSELKRNSRRVVLTGAEGLTLDDVFLVSNAPSRPAPASPPCKTESSLDDINLRFSGLGISVDFPSPPRASTSSRRDQSPTPSESSTHTSASECSRMSSSTPPTSDDESSKPRLTRSPSYESQHASVLYINCINPEQTPNSDKSFTPELEEEDYSDGEDASWFAEDIADIVTLSSPLSPSFLSTPTSSSLDPRARPDSLPPPPHRPYVAGHSRYSKPLPVLPRISVPNSPSFQLDPTFIDSPYRRFIPIRPPPPPPIRVESCPSPTMEEKTDELLALLANAALGSGFLGTGLRQVDEPVSTPVTPCSIFAVSSDLSRPPPRSSIPADISDTVDDGVLECDDGSIVDLTYYHSNGDMPQTPESSSIYSNVSLVDFELPCSPISSFDFEVETPRTAAMNTSMLPTLPESPVVGMYNSSSLTPPTTSPFNSASAVPERILRSRWSSSTLASFDASRQPPPSASSWMPRFHLPGTSPTKPKSPKGSSHSKKPSAGFKVPLSPSTKRSLDLEHGLMRRESMESRLSIDTASDSGDSTSSNGLRRKPIPVEIFMR